MIRQSSIARHSFIQFVLMSVVMSVGFVASCATANAQDNNAHTEVWRLAGTFNGWNTADDSYRCSPLPDGTYWIQCRLPAGIHHFKFVRNGDWSYGHFGLQSGSTNSLSTPGDNITLRLTTEQPIAILLDPSAKKWWQRMPEVAEPIVVSTFAQLPRVSLPVVVDFSASLLPKGASLEEIRVRVGEGSSVEIRKADRDNKSSCTLVPLQTGRHSIVVQIKAAGKWSGESRVEFDVHDRVYAMLPNRADEGVFDFVPIDGTQVWALLHTATSTHAEAVKVQDVSRRRYITAMIKPQFEGEQFAIVYSRYTDTLRAIPGQFQLQSANQQYTLIEEVDVPTNSIFHDPRRPDHFTAISEDLQLVELTAFTNAAAPVELSVMLGTNGQAGRVPMVKQRINQNGHAVWNARIRGDWNFTTQSNWMTYSIQQTSTGPTDEARMHGPFEVQIKPTYETPDWAKQAVWYQIFPERFRNGNPNNDPHGDGVFFKPWTSEWQALEPGEFEAWQSRVRAAGEDPDAFDRNNTGEPGGRFYNAVWDRRYGGDLQGIIDALDELQDLGVTALYLNPIFEGLSMHKYDTSDFRHVDDNFGNVDTIPPATWAPDPDEDYADPATWKWNEADRTFLQLIEEVHARNMRIIIDGVFNHVGRFHPVFQDVVQHGIESPYAKWFTAEFNADGDLQSWVAWDGPSGWLPKLKQQDNRDLVWPVRQHIFDITTRWMDPNGDGDPSDGIDGWRLDVPLDVGDPFWRDWCSHVRRLNEDAFISGEIWTDWESVSRLRGDMFDAQMHYPFARAVIDWLVMRPAMNADDLANALNAAFLNDGIATQLVQQNLYASHDTDRMVSGLFNHVPPRTYDSGNRPQQGEGYSEDQPDARSFELLKLAVVIQATYPGAPMIYYGQEVGVYGADDPSCRKPYPWPHLGPMDNRNENADLKLRDHFKHWMTLRASHPVLQLGLVHHLDSGNPDVFAFERRLNDRRLVVVINRSGRPYALDNLAGSSSSSTDTLPPMSAIMYEK